MSGSLAVLAPCFLVGVGRRRAEILLSFSLLSMISPQILIMYVCISAAAADVAPF